MSKKKRFSKQDLLSSGMGKLFETLDGKLPKPPMLMMDKIIHISDEGVLLANTIAATSGVEWISVTGLGGLAIGPNDILTVDQEKLKILNTDPGIGSIRVRRAQQGTSAGIHTAASILWEDPRRFSFNTKAGIQTGKSFRVNAEYYFNPSNVVAIGTARWFGI